MELTFFIAFNSFIFLKPHLFVFILYHYLIFSIIDICIFNISRIIFIIVIRILLLSNMLLIAFPLCLHIIETTLVSFLVFLLTWKLFLQKDFFFFWRCLLLCIDPIQQSRLQRLSVILISIDYTICHAHISKSLVNFCVDLSWSLVQSRSISTYQSASFLLFPFPLVC